MIFEEFDPARDLGRTRIVADTGTNKIIATETDPYGFWYIRFERGTPPEKLKGAYTNYELVKRDVDAYLKEKGKVAVGAK